MFRVSVSYVLLCGQVLLLLTVLLLQSLEGIQSQNASITPENGLVTSAIDEPLNETLAVSVGNDSLVYNPPSPVVLCSYL